MASMDLTDNVAAAVSGLAVIPDVVLRVFALQQAGAKQQRDQDWMGC